MNALSQIAQDEAEAVAERVTRPAPATGAFEAVARQFSRPEGIGGRLIAALMGVVNWLPNRHAIRALDVGPADDVLEVGFGPGHALKTLAALTPEGSVTGVDRSTTMFATAGSRNADAIRSGQMTLLHGALEALPLKDGSMDRILAVNVLYFVDPLSAALDEAFRVLRPGGALTLYVTDCGSMEFLQFVGRDTKHSFDRDGLAQMLQASRFGESPIVIDRIWLPFGFRGLVARVRKSP